MTDIPRTYDPAAAEERDYGKVTLRFLQRTQPWTIPYSPALNAAMEADEGLGHLMGAHAVHHTAKTLGQIAAIFEAADHTGERLDAAEVETLAGKAADLVTVAMRFANLYGFDLAEVLVHRSEEKNRVTLPAWPQ